MAVSRRASSEASTIMRRFVAFTPGGRDTGPVPGIEVQMHSRPAAQGVVYPFTLYTHCGVGFAVNFTRHLGLQGIPGACRLPSANGEGQTMRGVMVYAGLFLRLAALFRPVV
jgi:hypothetical protein